LTKKSGSGLQMAQVLGILPRRLDELLGNLINYTAEHDLLAH